MTNKNIIFLQKIRDSIILFFTNTLNYYTIFLNFLELYSQLYGRFTCVYNLPYTISHPYALDRMEFSFAFLRFRIFRFYIEYYTAHFYVVVNGTIARRRLNRSLNTSVYISGLNVKTIDNVRAFVYFCNLLT